MKNLTSDLSDPFNYHAHLLLKQSEGMISGYEKYMNKNEILNEQQVYHMIFSPDIREIQEILKGNLVEYDRCSALIKILPNNEDIVVSHNTWIVPETLLRVWKIYNFPWRISENSEEKVNHQTISLSSYFGILFSEDDFYMLSNKMIVTETSLQNNNVTLNQYIKPNQISVWIRTMIANRLSKNGKEWCDYFSRYNNGCYNNQFMIIDLSKFEVGKSELNDGLLYVLEQMPGTIIYRDMTNRLREEGYWPSYNLAYFSEIREINNVEELINKYGDYYVYEKSNRAKIFNRDHKKIKNIKDVRELMRQNNYKNDEFSICENCTPKENAYLAIASRADLNPPDGIYPNPRIGFRSAMTIDCKLTSYKLYNDEMRSEIISSPPYNEMVPPFQWSTTKLKDIKHEGQPDLWNFKWHTIQNSNMSDILHLLDDKNKDDDKENGTILQVILGVVGGLFVIVILIGVICYIKFKQSQTINSLRIDEIGSSGVSNEYVNLV